MKPKRVGEMVICGTKVGIYLAHKLCDEGTSCAGLYDTDASRIYIDDANGEEMVRHVLVHEVAHAVLHLSGAMHELEEDLKEGVDPNRVEERLVRALTPHLVALMSQHEAKRKRAPK
jgi:Zn-dependent peptidase ImmA (M78 family)